MSAYIKKEEYIDNVRGKIGRPFDFDNFFSNDELPNNPDDQNFGAVVLITSNQVILISNVNGQWGFHDDTLETIATVIYNLPEESNLTQESKAFVKKNITIRLANGYGDKSIHVNLPNEITQGHIDLLKAFQNTYGSIVERLSKENIERPNYHTEPLVVCTKEISYIHTHSFERTIEIAESLPIVEDQDPQMEFILGQVLSNDGLTLRDAKEVYSLEKSYDKALEEGVTSDECNGALGFIKGLLNKLRGDR